LNGTNFMSTIADYKIDLIQNDFKFSTNEFNNGKENQTVFIVEYSDYELIKKQ